jgi:hypothetical protein
MATESPLIHDGAQTVAAANYGNSAGLPGPGGSGQFLAVALSQATDRTSVLASVSGQQIYGILQNKPALGEVADVGIFGVTKAQVGASGSTRGKPQMVDATGAVTDWVANAGNAQIGNAIESGAVGALITLFVGAPSPKLLT